MGAGDVILFSLLWFLPTTLVVGLILYVAYMIHDTREKKKERAARGPDLPMPNYAAELRDLNNETEASLAESRRAVEAARDTLRRGLKG